MRWLLFALAVVFALWGAMLMLISRGSVHDVQAYVCWLTAVCALSGAAIVEAVGAATRASAAAALKPPPPHRYPE